MTALNEWREATKREPCPICEKSDWCSLTGPKGAIDAVVCMRVESDNQRPNGGWLHRLCDEGWKNQRMRRRRIVVNADSSAANWGSLDFEGFAAKCFDSLSPSSRERLAEELGVSVDALNAFCVGWIAEHRAFTFPMVDAAGVVRGIRLRGSNGRKWSIRGGREGLFVPRTTRKGIPARLLVCEGPTDSAAMFDLGFDVVGRPSCTGGVRLIVELVQDRQPKEAVMIADSDAPGMRGANSLATVLAVYVRSVRVVTLPAGVKDARDWRCQGATRDDVLARIAEVKPRRLDIVTIERERTRNRKSGTR